ncbi:c-type cytochrome [Pseudomonas sp. NPDC087342]|uniref:c-type cytochrome n=1 Tax=Pseudomonas sp. NPDC087342 TaxID=3364437 RepID=UPI00380E3D2D
MKKMLAAVFLLSSSGAYAVQEPEAVFNGTCTNCHSGQSWMAPKKGDHVAWKRRLEKGTDVLVKHVTEGFRAMPARGLCMDCTEEDYKAVIAWMSK